MSLDSFDRALITVEDMAKFAGVTPKTVRRWVRASKSVRLRADVRGWIMITGRPRERPLEHK